MKVSVEKGVLTIQGERKQEKEEKRKKFHRIERAYGAFQRSFTRPDDADAGKVSAPARPVSHFIEKPHPSVARELIGEGGVWNTMVMVFKVFKAKTLIDLIRRAAPKLHQAFHPIWQAIGIAREAAVIKAVYRKIESINFSKDLLEIFPSQASSSLWVLPIPGVLWSDWGSEQRIMNILEKRGHLGLLSSVQDNRNLEAVGLSGI